VPLLKKKINIEVQIFAVIEHLGTIVEVIKHGAPTTLANWDMVNYLITEMKELGNRLNLIQRKIEKNY